MYTMVSSTGAKWKSRRRMLTPSFHFNILKDFLLVMNNHAGALRDKMMQEVCGLPAAVDVFPYITLNSLDMICGKHHLHLHHTCKHSLLYSNTAYSLPLIQSPIPIQVEHPPLSSQIWQVLSMHTWQI